MFSLQKLIPSHKANLRPGVFSNISVIGKQQSESFVNNSTQDTTLKSNGNITQSVDTNNQTKKTPPFKQNTAKYSSEMNIRVKNKKENSQPKNLLEQFHMFQNNQKNDLLYQLLEQNIKNNLEKQLQNPPESNQQKRRTSSSPSMSNKNNTKCPQKQNIPKTNEQKRIPKKPDADPYFLQQKQSPAQNQQIPTVKITASGGKKLNFNVVTPGKKDPDNVFLDTTNQMANMIIENILNKDDYYERIKKENQEIKDQNQNYIRQIAEIKKKLQQSEGQNQECKNNLEQERQKYQSELMKIQDKLSVIKNLQSKYFHNSQLKATLQNERSKNEANQKLITELQKQNSHYKGLISSAALASVDYLGNFSSLFNSSQQSIETVILQLLKMSVSIVLEIISKAQILKLPALSNCHIPESLDLEEFFTQLEQVFKNNESSSPSNSSELSFRQKTNTQQNSLPLSQVQYKQPSNSMSLQEQFNTFLAMQDDDLGQIEENMQQLGSPYFTHTMQMNLEQQQQQQPPKPLQEKCQNLQETKNINLPRQIKESNNAQMLILQQNRFKTDASDSNRTLPSDQEKIKQEQSQQSQKSSILQQQPSQELKNFHSFNKNQNKEVEHLSVVPYQQDNSANDTLIYDSLFQEMNKSSKGSTPPKKQNSLHTLKYLDEQIDRSKQPKKGNKENISMEKKKDRSISSDNCMDLFAVAKFDYQAQKENDLTFKKGENIQVLKKTQNGWWIGLCKEKIGYFPYNFVTILE